jgi:Leucine-rich repeat (LRR) protein
MSVSSDSTLTGTVDEGRALLSSPFLDFCSRALLSSTFLDFCSKVRNNDPSILPALHERVTILHMCEREGIEFADALLESTSITYLYLETGKYTKSSAEVMAKYVRTSKHLQEINWNEDWDAVINDRELVLRHREEMFSCFLPAIQESTSIKELHMELPSRGRPSNQALENMLTHTQSLRSLTLCIPPRDFDVGAVRSGLKKNTTLRELTLSVLEGATDITPILTNLRDLPQLRRLCLSGEVELTGLDTLLLSDSSKISELDIHGFNDRSSPMMGLTRVLQALAQRPTLTKLGLHFCPLGCDEARLLQTALCSTPSLQALALSFCNLGSAELAELAPALYHNTSIKVLDISGNNLNDMECAGLLRDIIRCNKTIAALDLSRNTFGEMTGTVECIADGMGSNSTVLEIDLSNCHLGDGGVSALAQRLVSQNNTTLQKLLLRSNTITSTGVAALLGRMEQSSNYITDLDLWHNGIGDEGACHLAMSLENNALPNLTRLSLLDCRIHDDGLIALVSALEQNTSLLYIDLRNISGFGERAFFALAERLPEIKVLQRADFEWCTGLALAMPLLLAGLRKNTSLFRFHVAGCTPSVYPPTIEHTAKCAGGWMQEMKGLGYRNRCLTLIKAPKERLPPLGVWPRALALVATLPTVLFELLRSKPSLVASEDTESKEAGIDTGVPNKRKRGDE